MAQSEDLSVQQRNLFQQGYQSYSADQLKQIEWGLRFTPAACSLIALWGLMTQNPALLLFVAGLGIWAFFFPAGHPMDLLYNRVIRHAFGAVALPANPFQRRLACASAGVMNIMAATAFWLGAPMAAYVIGGLLLVLQAIVIFTHFCTLSWMYEGLMRLLGKWHLPLTTKEAMDHLSSGALLVDVRGPDEFSRGHLSNARNIPLDDLEHHTEVLTQVEAVLLYCASGTRSQIAKQKLHAMGLKQAHDMGAMKAYEQLVG
jgi:rhodanese-related sulfurtransferase/putative effector of murein hydrolase LrgA (UPF0299 family)